MSGIQTRQPESTGVRPLWHRTHDRATLYVGKVPIADIYEYGGVFKCELGCRIFASGGITNHATLDEAIDFVGREIGGEGED